MFLKRIPFLSLLLSVEGRRVHRSLASERDSDEIVQADHPWASLAAVLLEKGNSQAFSIPSRSLGRRKANIASFKDSQQMIQDRRGLTCMQIPWDPDAVLDNYAKVYEGGSTDPLEDPLKPGDRVPYVKLFEMTRLLEDEEQRENTPTIRLADGVYQPVIKTLASFCVAQRILVCCFNTQYLERDLGQELDFDQLAAKGIDRVLYIFLDTLTLNFMNMQVDDPEYDCKLFMFGDVTLDLPKALGYYDDDDLFKRCAMYIDDSIIQSIFVVEDGEDMEGDESPANSMVQRLLKTVPPPLSKEGRIRRIQEKLMTAAKSRTYRKTEVDGVKEEEEAPSVYTRQREKMKKYGIKPSAS